MLDGETASSSTTPTASRSILTQDALRARGVGVDLDAFNAAMQRQKAEARASWAVSGEARRDDLVSIRERKGATEFLGYDTETAEGQVRAIVQGGKEIGSAGAGEEVAVVLNQTAVLRGVRRSGRRHRDDEGRRRSLHSPSPTHPKVADGLFIHRGKVAEGTLKVGAPLELVVDHERRTPHPRQHIGDASSSTRACARFSAPTSPEGFDGFFRPSALRLLASQARGGGRTPLASRRSPTTSSAEHAGRNPPHGGRRRDRARRHGPRREVRDEVRVVSMAGPRMAAGRQPTRSSFAAARTHGRPATSASSMSSRRARSAPASAASKA